MKIAELRELEIEAITGLQQRSNAGDNDAARVLLEHLRAVSEAISKWQTAKDNNRKPKTE